MGLPSVAEQAQSHQHFLQKRVALVRRLANGWTAATLAGRGHRFGCACVSHCFAHTLVLSTIDGIVARREEAGNREPRIDGEPGVDGRARLGRPSKARSAAARQKCAMEKFR
jgi:hypothetical protein